MSPENDNTDSDRQSETIRRRRGRPAFPRDRVLTAADALFAEAGPGQTVTMDAIAAAAGVGKGTLFRAFDSRDGLLDALVDAKFAPIRETFHADGEAPGPVGTSRTQLTAFLDALLAFKLENRHLMRAREVDASGSLHTERYRWMHGLLRSLIHDAAPRATTADPAYAAHALLAALRIDLVEELLATGHAPDDIRRAHAALTRAVLDAR